MHISTDDNAAPFARDVRTRLLDAGELGMKHRKGKIWDLYPSAFGEDED